MINFEDLERKKNNALHMAVSNWYARLTYCNSVTDDGEHVGYCCPTKLMDELESILAAPLPAVPIQKQDPAGTNLITEEEATTLATSAVLKFNEGVAENSTEWLEAGGRELLNTLNANRVPVQAEVIPCGWQLMPLEPTNEMIAAMSFGGEMQVAIGHASAFTAAIADYKAMLSAAPKPEPACLAIDGLRLEAEL